MARGALGSAANDRGAPARPETCLQQLSQVYQRVSDVQMSRTASTVCQQKAGKRHDTKETLTWFAQSWFARTACQTSTVILHAEDPRCCRRMTVSGFRLASACTREPLHICKTEGPYHRQMHQIGVDWLHLASTACLSAMRQSHQKSLQASLL